MTRPTLAGQLADRKRREEIAKLSKEELIGLFMPHTFWQHISFWFYCHFPLLHQWFWIVIWWVYPFDIEKGYRRWRWE